MTAQPDKSEVMQIPLELVNQRCREISSGSFKVFWVGACMITVLYCLLVFFKGEGVVNTWLSIKPYLLMWRLLIFTVLIGGWSKWVQLFGDIWQLPAMAVVTLTNCRWRLACFLVWLISAWCRIGSTAFSRLLCRRLS